MVLKRCFCKGNAYVCVCVLSRGCAYAWISSLIRLWGIGPSYWASCCCCTPWRRTSLPSAGSSLSIALKLCLWRLSCIWTVTRNSHSLLVCHWRVLVVLRHPCVYARNFRSAIFYWTAITAVRTNVANLSDTAMWKIRRARFARNRQKSVRSLRDSVKGGPPESKRAFSLPESLSNRLREYQSPSSAWIRVSPLVCGLTVFEIII